MSKFLDTERLSFIASFRAQFISYAYSVGKLC